MHDKLLAEGYGCPIATPCTQEIDEMIRRKWINDGALLIMLMRRLIDRVLVFGVSDMTEGSPDYLGVMRVHLKQGEIVMVVPWARQYDEGGQVCIYRKGNVDVLELDLILVQLIEYFEADRAIYI